VYPFIQISAAPLPDRLKLEAPARRGVPVLDSCGSSEALGDACESVATGGRPGSAGEITTDLRIVDDDAGPPAMHAGRETTSPSNRERRA
jgi:hypothetical protein